MKGSEVWVGEAGGWEGGWGKGYQDSQCIFFISNTKQHVIVEMALVQGNSLLREKNVYHI